MISQIYGIKMISQGQKIKISNTLTEKGRWDDTQRPFYQIFTYLYIEILFYHFHFFLFYFFLDLLLFLSEIRINLQESSNQEGDGATCHYDDEEHAVTYHILQISRNHARQHQSEIGDARTDGIMGGFELSLTVEQHVEGKTVKPRP